MKTYHSDKLGKVTVPDAGESELVEACRPFACVSNQRTIRKGFNKGKVEILVDFDDYVRLCRAITKAGGNHE